MVGLLVASLVSLLLSFLATPSLCRFLRVLHGESITDQASPRTPTQCTFQPQEAVQPQRNQTILQADTPAQKANYSYKWSHPTSLSTCNIKYLNRWLPWDQRYKTQTM